MKRKVWMLGVAMALVLLPLEGALAGKAVNADNKDDFSGVAAAVRQEMAAGGRYEFVDRSERSTIDARLTEMQALLDKYGSVAQMNSDAKIKLMNDQEEVNAILTKRDSNRKVCESRPPTGSLLPQSVCRTYGDIERSRRDSQKFMHDAMAVPQNRNGG